MFPAPTPDSTTMRSERSPCMALSVRRNPATFSSAKVIPPATSTSCSKGWSPLSRSSATEERVLSVHGPGRFLGELSLITGQAVFVTASCANRAEVLVVPLPRLREVVSAGHRPRRCHPARLHDPPLDPDRTRLRFEDRRVPFLARMHEGCGVRRSQPAAASLDRLGGGSRSGGAVTSAGTSGRIKTPVVIWRGEVLRNPSHGRAGADNRLAGSDHRRTATFDLVIVGSGPAGWPPPSTARRRA